MLTALLKSCSASSLRPARPSTAPRTLYACGSLGLRFTTSLSEAMLVDVAATLGSGSDTVRPVQPPSAAATAMASMAEGPTRNFVCMRGIEKRRLTRIRTTRPPVRGRPVRPANYCKSCPACRAPWPVASRLRRRGAATIQKGAMRLTSRPRPSDHSRLCWGSATAAETGADRLGLAWDQAFALRPLARQLARATYRLGAFTRLFLRWLFVMPAKLHFAENALALHLLLERLEGLIDVIVPDENLHASFLFPKWRPANTVRAPRSAAAKRGRLADLG